MKKIIIVIITVFAVGIAWYLLSPLFITTRVDEPLPISVTPFELNDEDITNGKVDIPDDIIIGQDIVMNESMNDMPVGSEDMSITNAGIFIGADSRHQGSGQLKIVRDTNTTYLRFEDFSVTNGPDLFITLNKGPDPYGEHVIISPLKGNKGDQNYDISEYDLYEYQSVSIYCRAFSVEFAGAEL